MRSVSGAACMYFLPLEGVCTRKQSAGFGSYASWQGGRNWKKALDSQPPGLWFSFPSSSSLETVYWGTPSDVHPNHRMKDGSHNKYIKKRTKDLTFMDANVSVMAFHIHCYHRVLAQPQGRGIWESPFYSWGNIDVGVKHMSGPASKSRLSVPRLSCSPVLSGITFLQVGAQCTGSPSLCISPARSHHPLLPLLPALPAASLRDPQPFPSETRRPSADTSAASTPRDRKTGP